jgi:GTP cyclohydrolase II
MNIENCNINSIYGDFDFFCFNFGLHEDENILCLKSPTNAEFPLIRIQSACFTAEIFRSKDCDCHEQLETSLIRINNEGGYLFYLLKDGRGAGIFDKIKGLKLGQTHGLDTADAYTHLGIPLDPRKYDILKEVFNHFNIKKAKLLTNNPRKIEGLVKNGINVIREPLEIEPTDFSKSYLSTKKNKFGHLFNKYL